MLISCLSVRLGLSLSLTLSSQLMMLSIFLPNMDTFFTLMAHLSLLDPHHHHDPSGSAWCAHGVVLVCKQTQEYYTYFLKFVSHLVTHVTGHMLQVTVVFLLTLKTHCAMLKVMPSLALKCLASPFTSCRPTFVGWQRILERSVCLGGHHDCGLHLGTKT